ncbi:STAS domain-containing protein [Mariniblastus sp.]|nr:STAS domain-containing protein [Mariniblastus sp.]MDC0294318.1 STAS domain-containing protein [Mariniblastus sp.]
MSEFECIATEVLENATVVKFVDQRVMDPARIESLGRELLSLVDATRATSATGVVLNFDGVSFFSSAAINKLIKLESEIKKNGLQLRLSNLRPEVRDLFSYTNLDSLFEIRDNQFDAIESLES